MNRKNRHSSIRRLLALAEEVLGLVLLVLTLLKLLSDLLR